MSYVSSAIPSAHSQLAGQEKGVSKFTRNSGGTLADMPCLLPQFRWPADTASLNFRTYLHAEINHLKNKCPICFRVKSVLSTTSPSTSTAPATVLDLKKLQLLLLEGHPNSVASQRLWTDTGGIGQPAEENFQAVLDQEALLGHEDVVIAAAATEAVALAKAAVKAAWDATLMIKNSKVTNSEDKPSTFSSKPDTVQFKRGLRNTKHVSILGNPSATQLEEGDFDELEPTHGDLEPLQAQLLKSIAARSGRRLERKAKRERASKKASASGVPFNNGSTYKKKHAASQDFDYTDQLSYLKEKKNALKNLTMREEHELSKGIQDLLELEKVLKELEERSGDKPMFAQWAAAAGIDKKVLTKRLNHGVICKDRMIKANLRLVMSIAKRYQGVGMSLQDLVQEGCRGLLRSVEKFDPSKGFKFSTYAHWWVKQSIRRSLSQQLRTIRLPNHMVEATYKVKAATKQLYSENGRHPDNEEVAKAAGLSMRRLNNVLLTPKHPRSLDQKISIDMDLKLSEVVSNPEAETSEQQLLKQLLKEDLEGVLESLKPREKQVVRWRFGMEGEGPKSLREIGEALGICRERVRQIELAAFRKLQMDDRIKPLQHYLVS